jgi:hypothetical protein
MICTKLDFNFGISLLIQTSENEILNTTSKRRRHLENGSITILKQIYEQI